MAKQTAPSAAHRRQRRRDQQEGERDQELARAVLPERLTGDHPGVGTEGECDGERQGPTSSVAVQQPIDEHHRDRGE
jgi:hypothetical protein